MQIPLLVLGLGLFLAPLWTFKLFQNIYDLETYQIRVDNEGIKLGRADVEILRWLQKSNRLIQLAETQHHIYHACAHNPSTASVCLAKDALAEKIILQLHAGAYSTASKAWRANGVVPTLSPGRFGPIVCELDRLFEVPVVPQKCAVCGLHTYWELDPSRLPLKTDLRSCLASAIPIEARVRLWGQSLRMGDWEYSLHSDRLWEGSPK